MKKLLFLSALFIFACSSDDSSDTNDNVPNGQYFFEIEIGNEVHRIQGINSEMFTNGQNLCSASLNQGTQGVTFRLSDTSAIDYVSGQPLQIFFYIENPQLGSNNTGSIQFLVNSGSFLYNYAEQNNFNFTVSSFVENTPMNAVDAIVDGVVGKISNITLSSIGTPPTNVTSNDGDNLYGSYEGILYFYANGLTGEINHDIPVPIKISFSAVRIN